MSEAGPPRKPAVFDADDPAVRETAPRVELPPAGASAAKAGPAATRPGLYRPSLAEARRGIRWGMLLLSAMAALTSLAATMWFARFVADVLARNDWIGWLAAGLLGLMLLAITMLLLRELAGFWRLGRIRDLRQRADKAVAAPTPTGERGIVAELKVLLERKGDMAWPLARFREHESDVHDPGSLLALADRELVAPLDAKARAAVAAAARRVSVATAVSPAALLAVTYVAFENVRLLRALATIYGGRPGLVGSLRLARLVLAHIVATGGIALTDDLLGQFLGQDLLRRLSRRLGEGLFNGALTARIGTAAVDVCRPLPFIEARPVRARDFIGELMRRSETETPVG